MSLKNESKIQTLSDTEKLRELITSILALEEMMMEILEQKANGTRQKCTSI